MKLSVRLAKIKFVSVSTEVKICVVNNERISSCIRRNGNESTFEINLKFMHVCMFNRDELKLKNQFQFYEDLWACGGTRSQNRTKMLNM